MRTDRLQQEYGVELRWTVFPLHPETPEEGIELAELFAGREEQINAMQARLRQLAAAEGLPLAERTRTYNSRRAQELGKWAEAQGKGDLYRKAVYRAYFVEGRNIAKVDELVRIAEAVSLPGDEARAVLTAESFAAAVDADWQRAGELGITAVPSHLCAGKRLVGFGSYVDFERLIGKG
ncbi:putative DsbA family dithiol-disulfide isomerase [Geobacter argillaceus]|uniref:Putative DsbA family dithiol-disulfide isomerase n=1 Tax=Geobacter argillaceus TaxID=345631 RepID=A0A562WQV5_9BACT|nr:putative DsbA family dithiol-disulfide isomerase [Geobacter argillaceus]